MAAQDLVLRVKELYLGIEIDLTGLCIVGSYGKPAAMDLREISGQSFQRHPWEMARFRFFSDLLRRSDVYPGVSSVLDVGAGDGFVSAGLAAEGDSDCQFTCWDVEYEENAAQSLKLGDNPQLHLQSVRPEKRFDLIMALDVLEHVDEDSELLGTLVRENLVEDGICLISVPAWQGLYTQHDKQLTHRRRYSPQQLERLASSAGLKILDRGGLFHSLLLPRTLTKIREQLFPLPDAPLDQSALQWQGGALVTKLVYGALRADNAVSRLAARTRISLPGLSVWVLCRRS